MFQINFQHQAATELIPGSSGRSYFKAGLVVCLAASALLVSESESANGATFRVDDTSLTVPAIHNDDWRAVKARKTWTRVDGDEISGDPRFVRFLARDYEFQLSDGALRIKTTWFAARKCVSTDELVSSLGNSKRSAIEKAFGSLDEMNRRLQANSADGVEGRIVIWAHFRAKSDESLPIEGLSAEDQATLAPFADLARQSFETRIFGASNCKESKDPRAARSAARSGGRRMPASRSRSKSTGMRRLPTGGLVRGALPQEGSEARSGIVRDRDEDSDANKQKWGFTITVFEAKPGSLVFKFVGQFTRCVQASSEAAAMAVLRSIYRPSVTAGDGKRTSYTVAEGGACEQADGDSGGSFLPGNFETPPNVGTPSSADSVGGIEDAGSLTPFPDPLGSDPASAPGEAGEFPELDDFDLDPIPTTDDPAVDVPDLAPADTADPLPVDTPAP